MTAGVPTEAPAGVAAPVGGLTSAEAAARRVPPEAGAAPGVARILRRNAFTRLNFLLLVLGVATLATGSAPDATFLAIAVINTVVGAVEEVRARRKLEALALLSAPHARVVRDGVAVAVGVDEVVTGDLLEVGPGDQLTADAVVVSGAAELDESLLTGESDPVPREPGDRLMSGSWVVAGSARATVTGAGAGSYAGRLATEARRFGLTTSELMGGINRVLRWLTVAMIVIGPVLFLRQWQSEPWRPAVRGAAAGLVGMIPEGLVLLTTLAFLSGAVRLGRRHVLVQELPAVETLARVDALCVDKTGTLTEGRVAFSRLDTADGARPEVEVALRSLARLPGADATMAAVGAALGPGADGAGEWTAVAQVPFSSARKWSGATFAGHGSWVVGAPEMVAGADPDGRRPAAQQAAAAGTRVLLVARSDAALGPERDPQLPAGLVVVAAVELRETPRTTVAATLRWFAERDVTIRVVSGDAPATVRAVGERVGLPGADRVVDARTLPDVEDDPAQVGSELADRVEAARIIGRVTPAQKRAVVAALQERGHTVAMTGDGVNDVLAIKAADLGIAMGSGSAVTRDVAQLVLLDDDFDVMPAVVAEGRRILANIETVACLFLVKNVYSLLISVATSATGWPYPFLPRHLTLISALGIGIPGFFLALGPSDRRFRPGFLRRVGVFSILAGTVTAIAVVGAYATARAEGYLGDQARIVAIVVTTVVTLWVVVIAARPLTPLKAALVAAMAGLFAAAYAIGPVARFFSLRPALPASALLEALALGAAAAAAIDVLSNLPVVRRLRRPAAPAAG